MKLQLKPPGTQRLKLTCDILLSTCAFKFNLRHYILASHEGNTLRRFGPRAATKAPSAGYMRQWLKARAHTRPLISSS
jgi:hypothetical protein